MAQPASFSTLSYPEYLAIEDRSATKHELIDGQMVAMTGGTCEHARLSAAIIIQLGAALRGKPCVVFSPDLRVRVEASNRAMYPDATVVCGRIDRAADDPRAVTNPRVIVEVLSDSTDGYDLGDTFAEYRRLLSVQEVVFVSQREARLDVYRRGEGGVWTLHEHGAGDFARLESLDVSVDVDELYRDPLA